MVGARTCQNHPHYSSVVDHRACPCGSDIVRSRGYCSGIIRVILRSLLANAAQETASQLARKSLSQAPGKGLPVLELTLRTPCVYNHAATVGWRPMRGRRKTMTIQKIENGPHPSKLTHPRSLKVETIITNRRRRLIKSIVQIGEKLTWTVHRARRLTRRGPWTV